MEGINWIPPAKRHGGVKRPSILAKTPRANVRASAGAGASTVSFAPPIRHDGRSSIFEGGGFTGSYAPPIRHDGRSSVHEIARPSGYYLTGPPSQTIRPPDNPALFPVATINAPSRPAPFPVAVRTTTTSEKAVPDSGFREDHRQREKACQEKPSNTVGEFVDNLDNYEPTIPDSVTKYFMTTAGLATDDPHVVRLISLATQKYMADIVNDAALKARIDPSRSGRKVMTSELLDPVLRDRGIEVVRPSYYK